MPLKLEITSCVGVQPEKDTIAFDVLDGNGHLHTLRITPSAFKEMVIDAMLRHAITKEALGIELSNAATYLTVGPKR